MLSPLLAAPISAHSRESGNPGPRTGPKNLVPASAGTSGIRGDSRSASRTSLLHMPQNVIGNCAARSNLSKRLLEHLLRCPFREDIAGIAHHVRKNIVP